MTGGLVVFHGFRSLVIGLNFGYDNVYLAWSASRLGNGGRNPVTKVLCQLHDRHRQVDSNLHLDLAKPCLLYTSDAADE